MRPWPWACLLYTSKSTRLGGPFKGQEADIHVVVHKVQAEKLPEVDDEFAQMISEFDTVGEMREDLGGRVDQIARLEQVQEASDKVLDELISKVDFDVPQGMVDAQIAARTEQIESQLAQAGFTLERYLEENTEEEANTPEAVSYTHLDVYKRQEPCRGVRSGSRLPARLSRRRY